MKLNQKLFEVNVPDNLLYYDILSIKLILFNLL